MEQANAQGREGGNVKGLKCPRCRESLIKKEGTCSNEYVCFNPACRGDKMEFPSYYGDNQEDIYNNVKGLS